jgi:hypothetical protein
MFGHYSHFSVISIFCIWHISLDISAGLSISAFGVQIGLAIRRASNSKHAMQLQIAQYIKNTKTTKALTCFVYNGQFFFPANRSYAWVHLRS